MLFLHRAERSDTLADALADVLAEPLSDPMCAEIVAVPARGVERWLQQHLARRLGCGERAGGGVGSRHDMADGIAANIDFSSPAALTDTVVAAVRDRASGAERSAAGPGGRAHDPWEAASLVWPLLAVIDDHVDDRRLEIIARHIGATATDDTAVSRNEMGMRTGRRYATARHLADLFERYGRQRPAMLIGWAAGDDTDGTGLGLPDDMAWQPWLWRTLAERVPVRHPALDLDTVCASLRDEPGGVDLPERLSVFGPTRITESFRAVAAALAVHRDVHLFVPHPGPALWGAVSAAGPLGGPRRADRPGPRLTHPLLASLSRDVQELQQRVAPIVDIDVHHQAADGGTEPATLLQALQQGLREDNLRGGVADVDSSLEIHACHGPERQVEVLRDRLLHLFADDETLTPRDVLVMCPDVETFAPLIRGAFGQPGLGHPAFDLRVRLADRGPRQINPVLDAVACVVELAAGRVTASDVADLASRPPVAARFGFDDDDLEMIRDWLAHSNVRWGLGRADRARFGLGGFPQGTFATGLDRVALGAVAEETDGEWLGTALPLAGVESTEIDLVGRFAEFLDRLADILEALGKQASQSVWTDRLVGIVDRLTAAERTDEWQRAQAIRLITEALDDVTEALDDVTEAPGGESIALRLADIRDLVAGLIAGRPTRANFRTGELTVCTMVPMRSVPHRAIVILGLDADAYPRAQRTDGDDVLGRVPLVGERNPRDEDRQLFLDAIGAARDHLLVFYSGADPVSGNRIPPAVVVSELAETAAVLCGAADTSVIVTDHTLHAFDRRNFEPGAVGTTSGPFSFDAELLSGARALESDTVSPQPIGRVRVSRTGAEDIDLATLTAFLVGPVEGFVRQRLGARIPGEDRQHDDELDVDLDNLDKWEVGDRFLRRMLAGDDLATCRAAELRRGNLPPFEFGQRALRTIADAAGTVYDAVAPHRVGDPSTHDVVIELPDGRRLSGSIPDVFAGRAGPTIIAASYSRLAPKHRLQGWLKVLALSAAHETPDEVISARVFGREGHAGVAQSLLVAPADAASLIYDLVRLRDRGLCTPLPLPLGSGADYAARRARRASDDTALHIARRTFEGRFGDAQDPYHRLVYVGDVTEPITFDDILAVPTPANGDGEWPQLPSAPGEPLFCGLARLLWEPLLGHETLS
ncbi:exodeoxyribonuclease V subunit gamma [Gordonia sp. NPDC003425]